MRSYFGVLRVIGILLATAPALAHQGDDPSLGDPASLVHACQRTSASGRVRFRFVSPTGNCPSNPAWQPTHWPKVPPSVSVQDISVRVHNSTDTPVASGAYTALAFDSERWDPADLHSTSTNPSRLTVQTAGKYLIYGTVEFADDIAGSAGDRSLEIRLNGSDSLTRTQVAANDSGSSTILSVSTHYDLAAGDYVELVVRQSSGVTEDVKVNAPMTPEFGMVKLP
jgi:hypothetical protein